MKRFLLVVPVLLILLNACGSGTAAAPPTPTSTPTNQQTPVHAQLASDIFDYLNRAMETRIDLKDKFSEVEHITGATYQITNVAFPPDPGQAGSNLFHVEARCECAGNAQCCSTTRTFVVTLMVMDDPRFPDPESDPVIQKIEAVPLSISNLEVWTFDHANHTAVVTVPWNEVRSFLRGEMSGLQLAADVEIR